MHVPVKDKLGLSYLKNSRTDVHNQSETCQVCLQNLKLCRAQPRENVSPSSGISCFCDVLWRETIHHVQGYLQLMMDRRTCKCTGSHARWWVGPVSLNFTSPVGKSEISSIGSPRASWYQCTWTTRAGRYRSPYIRAKPLKVPKNQDNQPNDKLCSNAAASVSRAGLKYCVDRSTVLIRQTSIEGPLQNEVPTVTSREFSTLLTTKYFLDTPDKDMCATQSTMTTTASYGQECLGCQRKLLEGLTK